MKWEETVASTCRYGEVAGRIWGDWNIIWEDSEEDYQGHASILAEKEGCYSWYEWWYGSCSGCDGWEAAGADEDEIETEMRGDALWLQNKDALIDWMMRLEGNVPGSNMSMERGGGLAFGIDYLGGGILGRVNAIRSVLELPSYQPKSDD